MRILLLFLSISLTAAEHSLPDTFQAIQNAIENHQPGAYLNFDPDDYELAFDEVSNCTLFDRLRMQDALSFEGPYVFKAFPFYRKELAQFWNRDSYAPGIFYTASDMEEWIPLLKFLKSRPVDLFIGDYLTPRATREILFGPECHFIPSAVRNRFDEVDRVETQCAEYLSSKPGYKVAVVALQGTGKFLQRRLLERFPDLFLIDLGFLMNSLTNNLLAQLQEKLTNKLRIIYTSALIPQFYEERKREYLHSLQILESYGCRPITYIVEAEGRSADSYLEPYCDHIHYSNINDYTYKNKGVNEARAVRSFLKFYSFDDNDLIIKLTGRYFFNDDHLLKLAASRPSLDAIASPFPGGKKVCTGCFAMRFKDYKKMMNGFDLEKMERNAIDIEEETMSYIQTMISEGKNVLFLDKMGITANICNGAVVQW